MITATRQRGCLRRLALLALLILTSYPSLGARQTEATKPSAHQPTISQKPQEAARVEPSTPQEPARVESSEPWYKDSNWWQVGLIILGTGVATAAFLSERKAVRLTQRADVLLESWNVVPDLASGLTANSEFVFELKNFGPTRANNIRVDIDFVIDGQPTPETREISQPLTLGANTEMKIAATRLGDFYDSSTISQGASTLRFEVLVTYSDVFGEKHRTHSVNRYNAGSGRFESVVDTAT